MWLRLQTSAKMIRRLFVLTAELAVTIGLLVVAGCWYCLFFEMLFSKAAKAALSFDGMVKKARDTKSASPLK